MGWASTCLPRSRWRSRLRKKWSVQSERAKRRMAHTGDLGGDWGGDNDVTVPSSFTMRQNRNDRPAERSSSASGGMKSSVPTPDFASPAKRTVSGHTTQIMNGRKAEFNITHPASCQSSIYGPLVAGNVSHCYSEGKELAGLTFAH